MQISLIVMLVGFNIVALSSLMYLKWGYVKKISHSIILSATLSFIILGLAITIMAIDIVMNLVLFSVVLVAFLLLHLDDYRVVHLIILLLMFLRLFQVLVAQRFVIFGYDEGRFWGFAMLINKYGYYGEPFNTLENPYYQFFNVIAYLDFLLHSLLHVNIHAANIIAIIVLNLELYLLYVALLKRLNINNEVIKLTMFFIALQQLTLPIVNFIPQTLSYAFLLVTLYQAFLWLKYGSYNTLLSLTVILITSTIIHITTPLTLILMLLGFVLLYIVFFKSRYINLENTIMSKALKLALITLLISLTYWIYSAALVSLKGGYINVYVGLVTFIKSLIEEEEKLYVQRNPIWLGKASPFNFYVESLLIASAITYALHSLIQMASQDRLESNKSNERFLIQLFVLGTTIVSLFYFGIVAATAMRRYFYTAFVLSPLSLAMLLSSTHYEGNRKHLIIDIGSIVLLMMLLASVLLSFEYVANKYMPFPTINEWILARELYALNHEANFIIAPLGVKAVYTDIRIAVPLTYYQLKDWDNANMPKAMLFALAKDPFGKEFVEKFISSVIQSKINAGEYNQVFSGSVYFVYLYT